MPVEVQGHTVPHLKALISGCLERIGLRCGSSFILRRLHFEWDQYFGSTIEHYLSFFSQILFVVYIFDTFIVKHLNFIL